MRINASSFNTEAFGIKSSKRLVSTSQVMKSAEKETKEKVNLGQNNKKDVNNAPKSNGLADILKSLQGRKEKILESKNQLIDKALSEGKDLSEIALPLEMYDEQLNNLDKEMQNAIAAELQKKAEEKKAAEVENVNKAEEPKTEEEAQNEKINETAKQIARFDTIEGDLSMVEGMKSRVKILEGEIKQDKDFRKDFAQKVIRSSDGKASVSLNVNSSKDEEIAHLNKKIKELTNDTMEEVKEINNDVTNNEIKAEKPTEEEKEAVEI